MRRILMLLSVAAMLAVMMSLSGVALAQPDVCVSIKGDVKVDEGTSTCHSDSNSQAVAVNNSDSLAFSSGRAVAVNDSFALAIGCTATTQNSVDVCVF